MSTNIAVSLLIVVAVVGCGPSLSDYTPRWVDYEEWGKLKLGMTLQETLDIMGEPYLPLHSEFQGNNGVLYLSFYLRPKLYPNVRASGSIFTDPEVSDKPTKPVKFDATNVWGTPTILVCIFENDRLVKFHLVTSSSDITDSPYIPSKLR